MPEKRKRRGSPKGLAAGEKLKRNLLTEVQFTTWSWVGNEVQTATDITEEHCLESYGFGKRSPYPLCANRYASSSKETLDYLAKTQDGDDDIVIVSDSTMPCAKAVCRDNPNCPNYVGQEKWENDSTL